jgi:hypothetical protein
VTRPNNCVEAQNPFSEKHRKHYLIEDNDLFFALAIVNYCYTLIFTKNLPNSKVLEFFFCRDKNYEQSASNGKQIKTLTEQSIVLFGDTKFLDDSRL